MKQEEHSYFSLRRVPVSQYDNFVLPAWLKSELASKSLRILDYGCGYGQVLLALTRAGYNDVYGCDIDKAAVAECQKNNLNVSITSSCPQGKIFEHSYDVIILSHVVEHIEKRKTISFLQEIKKLLAPNGKLLVAVPNAQGNTGCYWAYEDWTHTTLYTSGSLYYVLKSAGFNTVEFLDKDCLSEARGIKKFFRKMLLLCYRINKNFWNKVTGSAYHTQSEQIFSYELKARAQ